MLDFHTHFLPGIDDGAADPEESFIMLEESAAQGVTKIIATPHFYPQEESPSEFLGRRDESVGLLREYFGSLPGGGPEVPEMYVGAEVYYFPTMSDCDDLPRLAIEGTQLLLVEPPMAPWSASMLDEIERAGENHTLLPVIAHVDRYVRYLHDGSLFGMLRGRRLLAQVNASFIFRPQTADMAFDLMRRGQIHFIGTDMHNLDNRPPNMAMAVRSASGRGAADAELLDEVLELSERGLRIRL